MDSTSRGDCVMNPMTSATWIIASGIFPTGSSVKPGSWRWWLLFFGGSKPIQSVKELWIVMVASKQL